MGISEWIQLCTALNVLCWMFVFKIMARGWQRRIKSLALRRIVTITATVLALPTTIIWALAFFAKTVWDHMIYPAAQEYAELTGIRKEDA
jgi:hypothetical protein